MFRRRRARPVFLSERGQGLAVLLAALGVIFAACARAKGLL
ncbi:hypothetical protein ACETK8_15930 [Brevundimonas staleyi]|uniref:Uncharacterized protein n=1 Tax=Brevundimonas staleyi TaxID=74326 RepID=A0ABW0FYI5_9CAUL